MAKKEMTPEQRAKHSKIGKSNVRTSKSHERRVANMLTAWSGVPFRRRRVEGREGAVRVVELASDVIPCAGDFNFTIECKKGKDFSFDGLMANPKGSCFTGWWHQACYDASLLTGDMKRKIYPLLFFKPHPNWDWVAFSASAVEGFRLKQGTWFPYLRFDAFSWLGPIDGDISHSKKHKKMVMLQLEPVIICRWRDFEANVAPESAFSRFPSAEELTHLSTTEEPDT